jgi:hypothetical protein
MSLSQIRLDQEVKKENKIETIDGVLKFLVHNGESKHDGKSYHRYWIVMYIQKDVLFEALSFPTFFFKKLSKIKLFAQKHT